MLRAKLWATFAASGLLLALLLPLTEATRAPEERLSATAAETPADKAPTEKGDTAGGEEKTPEQNCLP